MRQAREEVEDKCQKLHTRVLALQADLEIARAERKELETLVNTLRMQVRSRVHLSMKIRENIY